MAVEVANSAAKRARLQRAADHDKCNPNAILNRPTRRAVKRASAWVIDERFFAGNLLEWRQ